MYVYRQMTRHHNEKEDVSYISLVTISLYVIILVFWTLKRTYQFYELCCKLLNVSGDDNNFCELQYNTMRLFLTFEKKLKRKGELKQYPKYLINISISPTILFLDSYMIIQHYKLYDYFYYLSFGITLVVFIWSNVFNFF